MGIHLIGSGRQTPQTIIPACGPPDSSITPTPNMASPLPIINLDTFLADPTSAQSQAEAGQVSPCGLA